MWYEAEPTSRRTAEELLRLAKVRNIPYRILSRSEKATVRRMCASGVLEKVKTGHFIYYALRKEHED